MNEINRKQICKFVVGSRLHNLHKETSDYDYRGIHITDLKSILSPFKNNKNTVWIEGDEDNTSFELLDFCKTATKGNPTILEILYSNMSVLDPETKEGLELRQNRHKFLDSTAIFNAARGYASNQYNKMNLFTPDQRTPKFAVAYIRTLVQTVGLLKTGELPCKLEGELRDYLYEVKYTSYQEFEPLIPKLTEMFLVYQNELTKSYQENKDKFTPDYEWIENFIYESYKSY